MMLAAVTHILPITNIRRACLLPSAGVVHVHVGSNVSAGDLIAEASLPAEHMALDIRRGLGLATNAEAAQAMTRQLGDRLDKEDVIAETHGLFARIVRAPVPGTIVFIGGGMVILRTRERTLEARTGISGVVVEVMPDYGAVIEENGALIQCAWGNGKIAAGTLNNVCQNPADHISADQINVDMRGGVVFGGHCDSPGVLHACADLQVRGLILASMRATLLDEAVQQPYPILVIEGFGSIPLNDAAFRLLSTSAGRTTCIHGMYAPPDGLRPEIVIPLKTQGQSAPVVVYFAAGQTVRVTRAPYTGKTGKILQIRQNTVALPNGLRAPAAEVQLQNDARVWIPFANLEVLETSESRKN